MKLFNRNKQTEFDQVPPMPPELSEYYHAEERQRSVVTWLLGFATLAVTIVLAFALFLGARWLVGKFRNNDTKPGPETVQPATTNGNEADKADQSDTTTTSDTPSAPTPGNNATDTDEESSDSEDDSPQTSSTSTEMPNTGPGDVAAISAAIALAATAAHHGFTSVKRKS